MNRDTEVRVDNCHNIIHPIFSKWVYKKSPYSNEENNTLIKSEDNICLNHVHRPVRGICFPSICYM